ncbi:MAG TPA: sugar ABC transporter substrate-binding protein [Frankiaceae bacterium]|nr:sugar ABC transporter substrate-binding protein [Frankiaceae bacterium]
MTRSFRNPARCSFRAAATARSRSSRGRAVAVAGFVAAALLVAACSGGTGAPGSSTAPINKGEPIRGQRITVLLPSFAQIPKPLLADFTRQTGVDVTLNSASFDSLHQQLVTSFVAGNTIADVSEVDWSWVGQFGHAGWYTPLENELPSALLSDMQLAPFRSNGHLYAVPYSNDFRMAAYNTDAFRKAGIAAPPQTFDELSADMVKLQRADPRVFPLTLPLSAGEGTATQWYLLTLAMGGQVFDDKLQPAFGPGTAGEKALQFEVDAVARGWISRGAVSNTNQTSDARFTGGVAAYIFGGPDELVVADDPTSSQIVGKAQLALVPGVSGPGATFGLPEGIGIPAGSKHKAAALAFVQWMTSPGVVTQLRDNLGVLPARISVLRQLTAAGKLKGGPVIQAEIPHIVPLFPQGAPAWYPKFSNEAGALINSAAKGDISVAEALKRMAATARRLSGT